MLVLVGALAVQTLLDPLLEGRYPLAMLYAAVAFAAVYAGSAQAALIAAVGYVAADVLSAGGGIGARPTPFDLLEFVLYVAIVSGLIWFAHRAREGQRLAAERAAVADDAVAGLQREVRERRTIEASLRQSEAQFRRMIDAMAEIAYLCDPVGTVTYVNARWGEYTGRDTGPPETNVEPIHPADRAAVVAAWEHALRTESAFAAEFRIRRGSDGAYHWFLSRAVPLRGEDGRITGWLGTTVDVHESRAAREAAIESEERMRLAVEGTDAGMWDQDLLTGRMVWSERLCELFGVEPGREPTPQLLRAVVDDDDVAVVENALDRLRAAPDTTVVAEFRVKAHGGVPRWLMTRGRSYADSGGRAVRASGLVLDITERKHLEEELRKADRRKDEFLAVLAHELRNPLAPIRYATRLLSPDTPPGMAEDARRMIDRQLAHMARLLDDLLDVNRISRGTLELRKEVVDLRRVVETAVLAVRPLIESVGHELEVRAPLTPVPVNGDATRLGQVVDNLLTNAAKYSERGGRITVEVGVQDLEAFVRVRDTGEGIAPEVLPHIFELFIQGNSKSEGKAAGLGIGLALSRQLVEMHGGRLTGVSEGLGKGSEFTMRLPKTSEVPAVAQPPRVRENVVALPRRQTVLIVDDNVDAALALSQILEINGYTTHVAHDGVTATEMAELLRPDVVFLDLGMPRMNGVDAARTIRRQPWGHSIRLIAITGWGQASDRERTRAAGFDAHLVKPVDLDEVQALLDGFARGGRSGPAHAGPTAP